MSKNASKDDKTNNTTTGRLRSLGSNRSTLIPIPPGGTRLQLPPGEPDLEALRSVTREWLLPRLVEKFLRVHGVELKHSRKFGNIANRLQAPLVARGHLESDTRASEGALTSAGPASKEIKSQAKQKTKYRLPM